MSKSVLFIGGVAALALSSSVAMAADWSDTYIGYRYGTQFKEPANPNKIKKNIMHLTHISGYEYGQNFFNLDVLQSNKADPVKNGSRGATEFYLVYRHQFNLNKVLDKDLSFGPVRGLGLTLGFDYGTKNNAFAPQKRLIVAGPTLNFDVPNNGFFDLSFLFGKEWNQCGLGAPACTREKVSFDPQLITAAAWMVPFQISSTSLKFQGIASLASRKGKGYANAKTGAEFLLRSSVMADVGQMLSQSKNTFWLGVGYEFWHNKYGDRSFPDGSRMPGTKSSIPMIQAEYHF